jgi:hypothetical protein
VTAGTTGALGRPAPTKDNSHGRESWLWPPAHFAPGGPDPWDRSFQSSNPLVLKYQTLIAVKPCWDRRAVVASELVILEHMTLRNGDHRQIIIASTSELHEQMIKRMLQRGDSFVFVPLRNANTGSDAAGRHIEHAGSGGLHLAAADTGIRALLDGQISSFMR